MAPELKPIDPKTPRWEPTADPADIVVPSLDTTAPPYDQIEQIEQLITIKLQNIDANFSKIQHVMANRILPAVKRYAVGTQPVREAAKFWTTFYEQAAQIRIPTYDDYSAGQEQTEDGETAESSQAASESTPDESSATTHSDSESDGETPHQNRTFDRTSSEVSFAPGQAAISSTPATAYRSRSRNAHDNAFASQASESMPSWSASLESPLMQLNRDVQSLAEDRSLAGRSTPALHQSEDLDDSQDVTQRAIAPDLLQKEKTAIHASDKGKAREGAQPLLHKVLHRNANSSSLMAATDTTSRTTSPLKFKPKTPVIKTLNPYLPPDSNPSDWKGVVDLKDPSVASPQRSARKLVPPPSSSIKLSAYRPSAAFTARANARSGTRTKTPPPGDDDSFDENFGMSPPVMTDYARLPKLGRTPKQEAAARIMKDLVDVERRGVFGPAGAAAKGNGTAGGGYGTESSMSSMPTPPSMTRYSRPSYVPPAASETNSSVVDASLDSIMRRVGLSVPEYSSQKPAPEPAAQPSRQPVFSSLASTSSASSATASFASSAFTTSSRSAASASSSHTLQPPPPPESEPSIHTPQPPQYDFYDDEVIGRGGIGGRDGDDSLDSLDYEDQNTGTAHADFLFANQDDHSFDEDSFDSSMGDDDDEPTDGTAPPFIMGVGADDDGDGFDDDSFDDGQFDGQGEEETVFGVPPAQRLAQQQMAQSGLRMLGQDLLQDTIGIGQQMALAGRVEESPTPWNGNGNGRG
ncbi:hypothetical protein LXA43DRAFT_1037578 [Ganoderma leucocontextum]|nr:hypothetical protein LXA43DRAFT_1037578 [Ganoderma leucocontextum]